MSDWINVIFPKFVTTHTIQTNVWTLLVHHSGNMLHFTFTLLHNIRTWFIASWTRRLWLIQTGIAAYGIHTSSTLTLMLSQITFINVCQTERLLTQVGILNYRTACMYKKYVVVIVVVVVVVVVSRTLELIHCIHIYSAGRNYQIQNPKNWHLC